MDATDAFITLHEHALPFALAGRNITPAAVADFAIDVADVFADIDVADADAQADAFAASAAEAIADHFDNHVVIDTTDEATREFVRGIPWFVVELLEGLAHTLVDTGTPLDVDTTIEGLRDHVATAVPGNDLDDVSQSDEFDTVVGDAGRTAGQLRHEELAAEAANSDGLGYFA